MLPEGYKFQYTWWQDFTIADAFGTNAIEDTYKRAFAEWHDNLVAMQELTLVLNWRSWHWAERNNDEYTRLYVKLYEECYQKCLDHFKDEELTAYWSFLDQYNYNNGA